MDMITHHSVPVSPSNGRKTLVAKGAASLNPFDSGTVSKESPALHIKHGNFVCMIQQLLLKSTVKSYILTIKSAL